MANLSGLVVGIRVGVGVTGSLFLDHETQRWRPVSDLDIFDEARLAKEVSEVRHGTNGSKLEDGQPALTGSGSGSESLARQPRTTAVVLPFSPPPFSISCLRLSPIT